MVFQRDISIRGVAEVRSATQLGRGGYGTVYSGLQEGTVVKRAHQRRYGNFLRELLLLSYLGPHPQVICLKDYHLEHASLVLERWSMDLWHILIENRGTQSERLQVLHDILRGLAHLHSKGVVHADLKSSNVVVKVEQVGNAHESGTPSSRVRACLIDYGLAGPSSYATVECTTLPYRETNPKSSWHHDIYSAGLVGLEMFGGITWVTQPTHSAALKVVSRVSSVALRMVLQGMLVENRNERLSAAEVLAVLTCEVVEPPSEGTLQPNRELEATATIARVLHLYQRGQFQHLVPEDRSEVEDVVISLAESLYYGKTAQLEIRHQRVMDSILSQCPELFLPR